jgi:hypothetical protein
MTDACLPSASQSKLGAADSAIQPLAGVGSVEFGWARRT